MSGQNNMSNPTSCCEMKVQEILAVQISANKDTNVWAEAEVDTALQAVNQKLIKYSYSAGTEMYGIAVLWGLWGGLLDALLVGKIEITDGDIDLSHERVNRFIQKYAGSRGIDSERLKKAIGGLEEMYPVLQDNIWKGADIKVSAKNHHLADLAHHPTPLGFLAALVVQFLRIGTFVNRDGKLHFMFIKPKKEDIIQIAVPALITAALNWLVWIADDSDGENTDSKTSKGLLKLAHLVASIPMIVEILKCADNWFGHLVSDMGGSKNTAGGGMGIPGIFVSLLYEFSALPVLKDSGLPEFVNGLYQNGKLDLRHELPIYQSLGKQAIPVFLMEVAVRATYFIGMLAAVLRNKIPFKQVNWSIVLPFGNRNIERMITIATMTFTVADTTDAAVHAAIESGGNWVLFAGKFVTRFNYVGAGRAALAIMKEISMEKEEAELIHEKRLLTEIKTKLLIERIENYKTWLEAHVAQYLLEDLEAFIDGFDYMNQGLTSGDSNLFIKGNVVIQRVLGREPQFTNQEEFDELMDSDIPLKL